MVSFWGNILFWRRFIDDILGLWLGTKREFSLFVAALNGCTGPYGIRFGDSQVGKSVCYLDTQLSCGRMNKIDYRLFKKPTDARLYLKTDSFHPEHVFKSVIISQMIRVIQRNSQDDTCVEDLDQLKEDLGKSGHAREAMLKVEPMAHQRATELDLYGRAPKAIENKVVFSVQHFHEIGELRKLVNTLRPDVHQLCGEVQITFALRKNASIGNQVVRNRLLSETWVDMSTVDGPIDQKCGGRGCLTCPQLFNSEDIIMVNGRRVFLDFRLTCRDNNVIYIAQCTLCNKSPIILKEDTYFGQTVTQMNVRMNGHRDKFVIDGRLIYEKSALSIHCFMEHKLQFDMKYFKLGLVKKVRPVEMDREESFMIGDFRTNIFGLNRYVVRT